MSDTNSHGKPAEGQAISVDDSELHLKGIWLFVIGIVALVFAAFVSMGIMSAVLKSRSIAEDRPPSPMPEAAKPRQRPRAALQADPTADMAKYRAEEEAFLKGYGWVDRESGIARIPVDRAIDIVAERGLPTPPAPGKPTP